MAGVIRREALDCGRHFSFQDVEAEAAALLAAARNEADQILAAAQKEAVLVAEQLRQEGRAAGLAEGRQAGLEQVRAEARDAVYAEHRARLEHLTQSLSTAVHEVETNKHRLLAQAERGIIELALAIARRVCKLAVAGSTEPARANAAHLLELARHEADLELHLHPSELESLSSAAPGFATHTAGLEHVRLVADETVARGGCLLKTHSGTLDASLDTQLDRIAQCLLEKCEEPPPAAETLP